MRQRTLSKRIPWLVLVFLLVASLSACARSAPGREVTEAAPAVAESTAEWPATEPLTATLEPLPSGTEGLTPTVGIAGTTGLTTTLPLTPTVVVSGTLTPAPGVAELSAPGTPGTYAVVGVGPGEVLNIRQQAGTSSAIVGQIPASGTGVEVTGAGQEVESALWVPVRYGDVIGWANSSFLARQMGTADAAVAARAMSIVNALQNKNWQKLAKYVHPTKGVRFSPYGYVRADPNAAEQDRVFRPKRIPKLWKEPTVFKWGALDGSGEPISMTFPQYYKRFVYDADFAKVPVIGFNERIGKGTTLDNLDEVYPGAVVVEYHFPGFDPQVQGNDWRSLRLVLQQEKGNWYLVGIVHDEWTT